MTYSHFTDDGAEFDAAIIADAVLRILDINRYLPDEEKIRVISITRGYSEEDKGYAELTEAIFVLTASSEQYYNFPLRGLSRDYTADPDDFNTYRPADWLAEAFYADPEAFAGNLLVPMGSRTYAACTGTADYELSYEGGMSWAVPWCAGFYALCCQVDPDITPQRFIELFEETGITTEFEHDGRIFELGKIVNPVGMVEALQ